MALEDLDLEFEDEEEQKQDDAISVDVDLSFSVVGEDSTSPSIDAPNAEYEEDFPNTPEPFLEEFPEGSAEVMSLDDARKRNLDDQRPARSAPQRSTPNVQNGDLAGVNHSAELEDIKKQLKELKEQMGSFMVEESTKLAVQKAESKMSLEFVSDAKLLDHQVNAMLKRIHSKVPGLRNEVVMINKYLKEFLKKTTSKK